MLFVDAKKAHLNPKCEEAVYIELPSECGAGPGICGQLNYWLYGFRKAASAWEALYSACFQDVGLVRGESCGVAFYHPGRDLSLKSSP
jgi:hypothetical protein